MLAEELLIIDGDAPLFRPLRPLVDNALRLEHGDDTYNWHGWNWAQIERFLGPLPAVVQPGGRRMGNYVRRWRDGRA